MKPKPTREHPHRILVVDDTPANLQVLTTLLTEQGYKVHPASDGELALEFIRSTLPDLILLDIRMPGMDGFEVCRHLKADERTSSIPVIFISVLEDEHDKFKAFQAGGVDYITKPISPYEVTTRVKTHLHLRDLTVRLEQKVRERTEELTITNQRLHQEIAERKKVEEALRASEDKYRRIVDTASEGICVLGADIRTTFVNARMVEMTGYTAEEMLGRPFTDLMFEEDWLDHQKKMDNRKKGISEHYERRLRHKDGMTVWTIVSATPICDANHHFNGSFGMFTDITERKQAEDILKETAKRLNQAQQLAHMGNWELDLATNTLTWSNELYRIFEIAPERFGATYEAFLDAIHPDDRETVDKLYKDSLKTKTPYNIEYRLLLSDGRIKYVYEQCETFYEEDKPIRSIGTVQDISERKKLEEQLHQSQKMEAIGQLAGGVAHDFNNMLSAIIGYSEIALTQIEPKHPLRDYLALIKTAGERSVEITRQLLAFARKQTIRPEILNLNQAIESMLKLLRRLIGEDIDLSWLPQGNLWPVKMDPSQIDQILANLCVNAKDAITGNGRISIETRNVTISDATFAAHHGIALGEYVVLEVSDNGKGMDNQIQSKIFEPFFTTKETGKGTGLGLSMVYGIVKQNGGFINVYSEPGYGSSFKIYLPKDTSESVRADSSGQAPVVARGGETILLVEDETIALDMVRQMLEMMGYTVIATSDTKEALRITAENPDGIDLLISDVVMPGMQGPELEVKVKEFCPRSKCLYMSGYTGNVIAHHGILEEKVNFIQKPFTLHELGRKVREILDRE